MDGPLSRNSAWIGDIDWTKSTGLDRLEGSRSCEIGDESRMAIKFVLEPILAFEQKEKYADKYYIP